MEFQERTAEIDIQKIWMFPAKYVEKRDDKHLINVLINDEYCQVRIFDSYACEGISNPNLLFLGVITGVGILQVNFIDANEYSELFKKKWNILFD